MPAGCPSRTRSSRATRSRSSTTGRRAGSTSSSPTRRSTSATSTTATTTSATPTTTSTFSEEWMAAVHRALKPSGSFYLAIGDEYAADLCVIARREIGLPPAQLDHLALHVRPADQEEVRQEPHAHPVLHEERERSSRSTPTPCASPAPARRPTPTRGPTPRASCRTTPGSCARRKPPRTAYFEPGCDTWNVSRVCGTFKEREGWHGCQMPIGVLNRIIKRQLQPRRRRARPVQRLRHDGRRRRAAGPASTSGIDQSEEYVDYARKRLEHALEKKAAVPTASPTPPSRPSTTPSARRR